MSTMRIINYVIIAVVAWVIGAFMMAWYNLDHPIEKEVIKEPATIINNYHFYYNENYFLMTAPPYHPNFHHPKPYITSKKSAI